MKKRSTVLFVVFLLSSFFNIRASEPPNTTTLLESGQPLTLVDGQLQPCDESSPNIFWDGTCRTPSVPENLHLAIEITARQQEEKCSRELDEVVAGLYQEQFRRQPGDTAIIKYPPFEHLILKRCQRADAIEELRSQDSITDSNAAEISGEKLAAMARQARENGRTLAEESGG